MAIPQTFFGKKGPKNRKGTFLRVGKGGGQRRGTFGFLKFFFFPFFHFFRPFPG